MLLALLELRRLLKRRLLWGSFQQMQVLELMAQLEHMLVKRVLVQKLKEVLEQRSTPNSKVNMVKLVPVQTHKQVDKHQLN